jgi:hypothetical protein
MPEGVPFDQLWNEAVDKYMAATNRSQQDKKLMGELHEIADLVDQIDKESTEFGGFRRKRGKFITVVEKTVKPFLAMSSMAASAVSLTPFAPASTIFGAVVFLVKAAGGVTESYDWIEQLFEKLGGFAQRLEEYTASGMNARLREKVLAILVCLLEILGRAETAVKSGRVKKYAAVLFLGQDDQVKASFDKLGNLFDDEKLLVQAISYATNQRIEKKTDEIDNTTKQTLEATEELHKRLEGLAISTVSSENKALLDDNLLTPAYKKNITIYNEYTETTVENTGDWLLSEGNVKNWIKGELPLLWVFGGPGTGKSCLSSILITTLRDKYPQDPRRPSRTAVAYFYFKEYDDDLRDLLAILKSLGIGPLLYPNGCRTKLPCSTANISSTSVSLT